VMNENKYPLALFWSEEDQEWVVTCNAFPGLSALGETQEKALKAAKVALRLFIETYEDKGYTLPSPETREEYSGQTRLRLSKSLHRRAVELAEREGVSLNQLIVDAVQARVSGDLVATSLLQEIRRELSRERSTLSGRLS
jgi:antitoxin HicB